MPGLLRLTSSRDEPAQHTFTIGRRHAGTVIADRDPRFAGTAFERDLDDRRARRQVLRRARRNELAAGRTGRPAIFDRVVDQVGDGLADQLPVGAQLSPFVRRAIEAEPGFFRHRGVELGDVPHERAQVERLCGLGKRPRFQTRDQQQRVERLDQFVGIVDHPAQRVACVSGIVGGAQCGLRAAAQTAERRLQIVGDVVGDLAQAGHQLFDAVEHRVEVARQVVEFVIGSRQPNTA